MCLSDKDKGFFAKPEGGKTQIDVKLQLLDKFFWKIVEQKIPDEWNPNTPEYRAFKECLSRVMFPEASGSSSYKSKRNKRVTVMKDLTMNEMEMDFSIDDYALIALCMENVVSDQIRKKNEKNKRI